MPIVGGRHPASGRIAKKPRLTTTEIWRQAAFNISPTKPIAPGLPNGLHPKMAKAMDRLGWREAATWETRERARLLRRWEAATTKTGRNRINKLIDAVGRPPEGNSHAKASSE